MLLAQLEGKRVQPLPRVAVFERHTICKTDLALPLLAAALCT
jgi:hypothetical protein